MSDAASQTTPAEKLAAVREWVDKGIAQTLDQDPSGFMLGIESETILTVLDEIAEVLM